MEPITPPPLPESRPDAEASASLNRRRRALLRGGVGAAPVLLTLTSRPVQAANSCVVASSFVSVATFRSRNPTTTSIKCATLTCEDWYNLACLPTTGTTVRPDYMSTTVGTLLGTTTSLHNGRTLWEVLKNSPYGIVRFGQTGVVQHLISMALNIQQKQVPMPGNVNLPYLQGVWQNYVANNGRYKLPQSGINWDSGQLISWLRMLMYPM